MDSSADLKINKRMKNKFNIEICDRIEFEFLFAQRKRLNTKKKKKENMKCNVDTRRLGNRYAIFYAISYKHLLTIDI